MFCVVAVFLLGFACGWVLFEKPEMAREAWQWVKEKVSK
jgi:hypothetical protein